MDYSLMRRNIYSAILLGSRETKYVVIFIYGSAYCTKRVVAVCKSFRP